MRRRDVMLAGVTATAWPAWAHHGWSSFDLDRPLYLEGRAADVRWRNPHAELALEVVPNLGLPSDLARRPVPAQQSAVDGATLLARAALPVRRDRRWTVELAPLFRLSQWQVPEIVNGAPMAVLGFTFKDEKGDAVLRAEYLFLNGRTYGMRSSPA